MYDVKIMDAAVEALKTLQEKYQRQVVSKLEALASDPRAGNFVRKLKGDWAAYWRLRSGDFRVVYLIDDDERIVTVTWIGNRRDAPYD